MLSDQGDQGADSGGGVEMGALAGRLYGGLRGTAGAERSSQHLIMFLLVTPSHPTCVYMSRIFQMSTLSCQDLSKEGQKTTMGSLSLFLFVFVFLFFVYYSSVFFYW